MIWLFSNASRKRCGPSLMKLFDNGRAAVRFKIIALCGVLIAANLLAWAWAIVTFYRHPLLLGSALIAYGFGLRHAVDADHIAAIDNVTRKLMQEGKRPIAIGFFFSLGHSTVVTLIAVAVCFAAAALESHFDAMKEIGGIIGTS